ncbi:MAG: putative oxidoreductase [Paracoccaceae bacterium]|jgi:putative oxidoreductase
MQNLRTDIGLLTLRLMAGTILVFHGSQMIFGLFGGYGIAGTAGWMESIGIPFATVSAVLAGGTQLIGGLAFLTGLFARTLSAPVAFALLVGALTAHSGFDVAKGGMEYPLLLAAVSLTLGLVGPGRLSIGAGRADIPLLLPAVA